MTQSNLFWLTVPEREFIAMQRHDSRWAWLLEQEAERSHIYSHTRNREQTETGTRLYTIKAVPQ